MRQRHLAMALSRLPPHPAHDVALEQYATPGDLAAHWLATIDLHDPLVGTHVADLGCGNGVLGLGALLLGARRATLVDADPACLTTAEAAATLLDLADPGRLTLLHHHLAEAWPHHLTAAHAPDLIIANPPWGTQAHHGDRPFLLALLAAPPATRAIHLLHHAEATHPAALARDAGWSVEPLFEAVFPLPAAYTHHTSHQSETRARGWRFSRA